MQFIINNFEDRSGYVHDHIFNVDNKNEKEIYNEIKILILLILIKSVFNLFIAYIKLNYNFIFL